MRPRFLVVLSWIRPGDAERDERDRPERTIEAVGVTDREAADKLFRALCALPAVRAGRHRAKVVDLAGGDTWESGGWLAPLVTAATRRALLKMGARRGRPWH